jgi:hypothetical protein
MWRPWTAVALVVLHAAALSSSAAPAAYSPLSPSRSHVPSGLGLVVRELRGGGIETEEDSAGQDDPPGRGEATAMLAKAEQLYRAAVTGKQKGKDASASAAEGSCSSFLKAVAKLFVTGSVTGASSAAKRDDALEQAAELFAAAALQLKLQKKSKEAGHALTRAADSYARHRELAFQAPAQYAEAAKILRREHPDAAVIALERAAQMSVECPGACNLQRAGRLRREQAVYSKKYACNKICSVLYII